MTFQDFANTKLNNVKLDASNMIAVNVYWQKYMYSLNENKSCYNTNYTAVSIYYIGHTVCIYCFKDSFTIMQKYNSLAAVNVAGYGRQCSEQCSQHDCNIKYSFATRLQCDKLNLRQ